MRRLCLSEVREEKGEGEMNGDSELEAFQLNRALIEISKGGKNHAISLDGGGIRGLVLIEVRGITQRRI